MDDSKKTESTGLTRREALKISGALGGLAMGRLDRFRNGQSSDRQSVRL